MRRLLCSLCFLLFTPSLLPAQTRPPNIVFFLADDLGYHDLTCFGSTFYETPNLDRLAARGTKLTHMYVAPVCSPTRATILTGQYPARTRITDYLHKIPPTGQIKNGYQTAPFIEGLPQADHLILPEALKSHGYATAFFGKWHLGPEKYWPETQGFDINKAGTGAGSPSSFFAPYKNPRLSDGPEGEHIDERLARETISFIESKKDQPFLAYFCLYSVHIPLQARKDLIAKYEEKAKRLNIQNKWGAEDDRKVRLTQSHPTYAAMVETMDGSVGMILDALDRLQLTDNTIIVFLSDNGGVSTSEGHPTSNAPLRAGKGHVYEGGVRSPCIISAPGVTKPGSTADAPVAATDFYPTLLDLAHLPPQPKQHVDGQSFVPALKGESFTRSAPIYWHYPHFGNQGGHPASAIRDGDFKLIQDLRTKNLELYNLKSDPYEQHNLASSVPEVRDRLLKQLDAWRADVHALYPSPSTQPATAN